MLNAQGLRIILCATIVFNITYSDNSFCVFTNDPITHPKMYADYPNLWMLDMSNQTNFAFPQSRVLLAHIKLARFHCNNCSVSSIYKESFAMLPKLTHLELDRNNLSYIDADAFEKNPLLQRVQLVGNNLLKINSEGILRHVTFLSSLNLDWNPGFDINQVQVELPWLLYFSCKHCNTSFVDKSTMKRWQRLGYLYLSDNHIDRVEFDAFLDMPRFKLLNVDRNRGLTNLTIQSKTLLTLSAEGCGLEGILDTSNLKALEFLNVRRNNISNIYERGFESNNNMQTILLDDNLIEKIPEKLLSITLYKLDTLCIDRNPLQPSELLEEFNTKYSSKRLRRGCLNDQNPTKAFEYILPTQNGVALYTKQATVHVYQEIAKLEHYSQDVVYIEEDYFAENSKVSSVILDHNSRYDFPKNQSFLKSEYIKHVSLVNCSISGIYEQTFKKLPNLKSINLKGNMISSLYSATLFNHNPDLESVNLANNLVKLIAINLFEHHQSLQYLNLNGNKHLSSKPGNLFLFSPSLETLLCQFCNFVHIDSFMFQGLPNLKHLDLSNNKITILQKNAFSAMIHLKHVDLSNNHLTAFGLELHLMKQLDTLCLSGNLKITLEPEYVGGMMRMANKLGQLDSKCEDKTFFRNITEFYSFENTTNKPEEKDDPKRYENIISSASKVIFRSVQFTIILVQIYYQWLGT
ncbi:protein artichoke-like [Culex pipiens pallens]|uniref:protein artichoke-like n=1 Tax=Culex pipiens pallens TaxID=42434 RepID=UPI0019545132|nr:protein artichoke-like [Culex pipiens pallens]XP_052566203.1 protein artichoke-like [Culex pipiens pallens]